LENRRGGSVREEEEEEDEWGGVGWVDRLRLVQKRMDRERAEGKRRRGWLACKVA
jgi:hypothetical protein